MQNIQRGVIAAFPGTPSQHEYAIIVQKAFRQRAAKRELQRRIAGAEAAKTLVEEQQKEQKRIRERKNHEFKSQYAQNMQRDLQSHQAAEVIQGYWRTRRRRKAREAREERHRLERDERCAISSRFDHNIRIDSIDLAHACEILFPFWFVLMALSSTFC
eukprot:SAG31_NODE_4868_length_2899_cov_1.641071_2_plen_159_part_00